MSSSFVWLYVFLVALSQLSMTTAQSNCNTPRGWLDDPAFASFTKLKLSYKQESNIYHPTNCGTKAPYFSKFAVQWSSGPIWIIVPGFREWSELTCFNGTQLGYIPRLNIGDTEWPITIQCETLTGCEISYSVSTSCFCEEDSQCKPWEMCDMLDTTSPGKCVCSPNCLSYSDHYCSGPDGCGANCTLGSYYDSNTGLRVQKTCAPGFFCNPTNNWGGANGVCELIVPNPTPTPSPPCYSQSTLLYPFIAVCCVLGATLLAIFVIKCRSRRDAKNQEQAADQYLPLQP
jgi:hypothetical protein